MLGELINKLTGKNKTSSTSIATSKFDFYFDAIYRHVIAIERYVYANSHLPFKTCEAYEQLKTLPKETKVQAVEALIRRVNSYDYGALNYHHPLRDQCVVDGNLLNVLMRTKLDFPVEYSFTRLLELMYLQQGKYKLTLMDRPFSNFAISDRKAYKKTWSSSAYHSRY